MEFTPYPKTPRLKRDIVITEKIDGTNAQIVIERLNLHWYLTTRGQDQTVVAETSVGDDYLLLRVGSRSRWITPGETTDNYGFAGWCKDNANELFKLGEGQHFGEWYGTGIQRGYDTHGKRFALFNTARWGTHNPNTPACCETVPVLLQGGTLADVDRILEELRSGGSFASPGFMDPEGIIVYHTASKQNFKVLLENDHLPKGTSE